jgi:hypothetical protein
MPASARRKSISFLAGGATLGLVALGIVSLDASASPNDPHEAPSHIECGSGPIVQGDVSTSSLVVSRDAADLPDPPGQCKVVSR